MGHYSGIFLIMETEPNNLDGRIIDLTVLTNNVLIICSEKIESL